MREDYKIASIRDLQFWDLLILVVLAILVVVVVVVIIVPSFCLTVPVLDGLEVFELREVVQIPPFNT
jgi:hypothetical protein